MEPKSPRARSLAWDDALLQRVLRALAVGGLAEVEADGFEILG